MRRMTIFFSAALTAAIVHGAWYWPFGNDEDDPSKPVRLHRLLEEANNYIETAEEEAANGNGEKALENYRLALAELDRVESENPDRAETAEFSPLRNKRAACTAAIDAIRFAQVDENERAVSVTDTRELQKKWNKKHGIKDPDDEEEAEEAPEDAPKEAASKDGKKADDAKTANDAKEKEPKVAGGAKEEESKSAAGANETAKAKPAKTVEEAESGSADEDAAGSFDNRYKTALAEVRNKDYAAADLLLEALMKERPKDLNVMLLRAAAQMGLGSKFAARRTLETAMRTHPKSYLPYYNLANLSLKLGEGAEVARQYYEMGRMVGGPAMPALEEKLK